MQKGSIDIDNNIFFYRLRPRKIQSENIVQNQKVIKIYFSAYKKQREKYAS